VLRRSPIGIFRAVDRPTYDDGIRRQIATASADLGDRTAALARLIAGRDT
jgi:2-oxoglutarate/2-oxoacid ferredoxin oxidoreductase subunit beta